MAQPTMDHKDFSRRTFLRSSATASAGLASILLTKTPPAYAQERELKLLTFSHFVPASDEELERQLQEFGKQAGVKVRMDRVAHLQLPTVYASEVQGQKGHDVVALGISHPALYSKHLVNLDDLVDKLKRQAGGLTDDKTGKDPEGHYKGIPWTLFRFPSPSARIW